MGLDMTMPIMGHRPKAYLQGSCLPNLPLSNMEMAALLDTCDARARVAEAQVAQLMHLMETQQQTQGFLPAGLPMWPTTSRTQATPEAQLPQRSLQQALAGVKSLPQKNPWELEGPASDEQSNQRGRIERHMEQEQKRLAKKLRPKQTLRGYLEELRSEDPRCIFIVRRINKLGFRSKGALESHYSKFGKVLQVCVAHSKVKPLPNSGQTARTRPGNFGLVVMQSPAAVNKVLDKGSTHVIDGVEVSVHKYQPSGDDEFNEEDEQVDNLKTGDMVFTDARQSRKDQEEAITSGSTQTGTSEGGSRSGSGHGINSGDTDDWNRQESGSSNSSLGSEVKVAQDQFAAPPLWPPLDPERLMSSYPDNEARHVHMPPEADQTYVVNLSHSDLQELREMLRLKSARSEADLSEILNQLQRLLEETQVPNGSLNTEKIMQAASLIQLAKHQLTLMHADCRSRMAEISMSMATPFAQQMPFDASMGAPPGFGRGHFGHSAQDR